MEVARMFNSGSIPSPTDRKRSTLNTSTACGIADTATFFCYSCKTTSYFLPTNMSNANIPLVFIAFNVQLAHYGMPYTSQFFLDANVLWQPSYADVSRMCSLSLEKYELFNRRMPLTRKLAFEMVPSKCKTIKQLDFSKFRESDLLLSENR
ncbi:hypothetical protein J6590_042960 [Homalodisca vitripennis]|nr:hypothetical protein J6590_042960 [Homalodisca vitripennis]